ncbi:DNA-protecting protein DprA [Egibacter rhizosphaerae]|uniref:DNA-protecting protein DprA n=1 Tax=Egibacter rhizosphaerae TaxID=1670831 RepID=A0A411YEE8_9ACTN|nr:DNA-processing protein DprA [Egibacter rhizosphaerae]QBI19634.1 DNA-protecting protein DprA [Egibacter rhizosphaerae]
MVTDAQHRLLTVCALRHDGSGPDWNVVAREALRGDGPDLLGEGQVHERSTAADSTRELLRAVLHDDWDRASERVQQELQLAEEAGASLVTVLDEDYPATLRLVHDLPPFLFIRGHLTEDDLVSVAVVGTRQPSDLGLRRAAQISHKLAARGVTVASGLAQGIDGAAHLAAMDADGRTIAVMGTGITRIYPAHHAELADRILDEKRGALVSQFWPSMPPARHTFPRRNRTMSGITQGTVVVEASQTSGAKMQARLALEHGKRVWLLRSLVTGQTWAHKYVHERGAVEVADVDDVLRELASPAQIARAGQRARQLALDVL